MWHYPIFLAQCIILLLVLSGCGSPAGARDQPVAQNKSVAPPQHSGSDWRLEKVTDDGGRVAWYTGSGGHQLLAFDAITDPAVKGTDVFIMRPNGEGRRNVTSATAIPKGFIGQPDWHPDGVHLVLQAENANSEHRLLNHMAWGINNDLWMVRRDGTDAQRILSSAPNHAALHPHFNARGDKLVYSERVPTGDTKAVIKALKLGGGGENHWTGWRIRIADFDIQRSGAGRITRSQAFAPNGEGFYETHGFTKNGRIVYSFTPAVSRYVDDIYSCDPSGGDVRTLVNSPLTWDEHGHFSPSGRSMIFISSRSSLDWRGGQSSIRELKTELYQKKDGRLMQLTNFNGEEQGRRRFLVSDNAWNADGTKVVFQVAPFLGRRSETPELWMISFPGPQ